MKFRKGDSTKQAILDHAVRLASAIGLEGLSIGSLASDLKLSKSGLFAHFKSKEALQVQVLEASAARFTERVVRPALVEPRGEKRVRALFDRWLAWGLAPGDEGGCVFVQAAAELDDRPGPARDRLVELQRNWIEILATIAGHGVEAKAFRPDLDPRAFAQELYGIMLSLHYFVRLLGDEAAVERARANFSALLARSRVPSSPSSRPASSRSRPRKTQRSSV